MRSILIILAAMCLTAGAAYSQTAAWAEYVYSDARVAVQFSASPKADMESYATKAGPVPAMVYALQQGNGEYRLTVADFSGHGDPSAALSERLKSFGNGGTVKLDVAECTSGQPGRELSIANADGSESRVSLFALGSRFYFLEAKVISPKASDGDEVSADTVRFQQSMRFTGDGLPDLKVAPICRGKAKAASRVD